MDGGSWEFEGIEWGGCWDWNVWSDARFSWASYGGGFNPEWWGSDFNLGIYDCCDGAYRAAGTCAGVGVGQEPPPPRFDFPPYPNPKDTPFRTCPLRVNGSFQSGRITGQDGTVSYAWLDVDAYLWHLGVDKNRTIVGSYKGRINAVAMGVADLFWAGPVRGNANCNGTGNAPRCPCSWAIVV